MKFFLKVEIIEVCSLKPKFWQFQQQHAKRQDLFYLHEPQSSPQDYYVITAEQHEENIVT